MERRSFESQAVAPDSMAVRVALWRALHVEVDPPPQADVPRALRATSSDTLLRDYRSYSWTLSWIREA